jgi:hypothetical protein
MTAGKRAFEFNAAVATGPSERGDRERERPARERTGRGRGADRGRARPTRAVATL